MPASDLTLLIDAAHKAGAVARSFVGGDLGVEYKDHDNSPVTKADLTVNETLAQHLRAARPGYGWLSEESADDEARQQAGRVFIVDPIDGTRSFIEGSRAWAHALAVVEQGRVTAAVVYLPMMDKLYTAAEGAGARLNGKPIRVGQRQDVTNAEVLAVKHSLDPQFWPGGVPDLRRAHRPSLAYRLSLVAEGRFDAMFTFRPSWEWDIAAGALILSEAGARVTNKRGAALRFNNPIPQNDGVLAANPVIHAGLLDRLI
ncbi:3'(2'),5'-bisphosphate nucleotidase CysQ [Tropicibacter naphthalenivorans]|uniref:Inositol-1-monophosphatase n=1 Tax=Tropicibacter naphthalenivorans TaxID=441103 RepID=A0A0P1G1F9_9RHOB|nr:3'(2'),5'-bisphosphate nucleotidase CysQ [Tropicibacter naphthalenivorans]CUH75468.1 Inositol-1-monophosphatase [Tropicibacter naphthalenivorans]SMC44314.1 myo-inositol-1(or 4)-monophosphatase [Tropicibacter naphthalenivorans]